jgi:hypothetical protein
MITVMVRGSLGVPWQPIKQATIKLAWKMRLGDESLKLVCLSTDEVNPRLVIHVYVEELGKRTGDEAVLPRQSTAQEYTSAFVLAAVESGAPPVALN